MTYRMAKSLLLMKRNAMMIKDMILPQCKGVAPIQFGNNGFQPVG
jgi:hypothetical protein